MRFKYAGLQSSTPNIDMTPMIDIVFNLLLFFLLSSSYVQHTTIDVRLPVAKTSKPVESEIVLLELHRDERMMLQGEPIVFDELAAKLAALYPAEQLDKPLLVRADAQSYHGHVVAILDAAREIGVKSLNIETLPPAKESAKK